MSEIPTLEEFRDGLLAREATSILYDVMVAGMNEEKKRTWTSWVDVNPEEHIAHGVIHMCNVHQYQNPDKRDKETGLPELWHAFTRSFFAVMAARKIEKEGMKNMVEAKGDD